MKDTLCHFQGLVFTCVHRPKCIFQIIKKTFCFMKESIFAPSQWHLDRAMRLYKQVFSQLRHKFRTQKLSPVRAYIALKQCYLSLNIEFIQRIFILRMSVRTRPKEPSGTSRTLRTCCYLLFLVLWNPRCSSVYTQHLSYSLCSLAL